MSIYASYTHPEIGRPSSSSSHSLKSSIPPADKSLSREALVHTKSRNREELIVHSRLAQFSVEHLPFSVATDAAMIAICLGAPSSNLEDGGWVAKEAAFYFARVFEYMKSGNGIFTKNCFCEKLLPLIGQLTKFWSDANAVNFLGSEEAVKERSEEISKEILRLLPGESYLMHSGWSGVPVGHSMYIRFEKCKTGSNYTIYLYNANADALHWAGGVQEGYKQKVPSYIKYEDVTPEELFFSSDPTREFCSAIIAQLLMLCEPSNEANRSLKNVLHALLPIQRCMVDSAKLPPHHFISMQRGPNCVDKSFNGVLFDVINDPVICRRHILDMRLFTTMDYFKGHSLERHLKNPTTSFILRQSAMSQIRMVDRAFFRQIITKEEYLASIGTLTDILYQLKPSSLLPISFPVVDVPTSLEAAQLRMEKSQAARARNLIEPSPLQIPLQEAPLLPSIVDPNWGKQAAWHECRNLLDGLQHLNLTQSQWLFQTEFCLYNVRHLKHETLQLSKEDSLLLLKECEKLTIAYVNSVHEMNHVRSMASHNTAMELLCLSYKVAVQADSDVNILRGFGLWFHYFQMESCQFLFGAHDPQLLDWRNDLLDFFQSLPHHRLFNFESEQFDKHKVLEGDFPEAHLYRLYHPKIGEQRLLNQYLQSQDIYFTKNLEHIRQLKIVAGAVTSIFRHHHVTSYLVRSGDLTVAFLLFFILPGKFGKHHKKIVEIILLNICLILLCLVTKNLFRKNFQC